MFDSMAYVIVFAFSNGAGRLDVPHLETRMYNIAAHTDNLAFWVEVKTPWRVVSVSVSLRVVFSFCLCAGCLDPPLLMNSVYN